MAFTVIPFSCQKMAANEKISQLMELHDWYSKKTNGVSLFDKPKMVDVVQHLMKKEEDNMDISDEKAKNYILDGHYHISVKRWKTEIREDEKEWLTTDDLEIFFHSLSLLYPNQTKVKIIPPLVTLKMVNEIKQKEKESKGEMRKLSMKTIQEIADQFSAHKGSFSEIKQPINPFRHDAVIFPVNFTESHWYLIVLNFVKEEVLVFDSCYKLSNEFSSLATPSTSIYSGATTTRLPPRCMTQWMVMVMDQLFEYFKSGQWFHSIQQRFQQYQKPLPSHLKEMFEPNEKEKKKEFRFPSEKRKLVIDMPQQSNSGSDCGIWMGLMTLFLIQQQHSVSDSSALSFKQSLKKDASSAKIRELFTSVVLKEIPSRMASRCVFY